MILWTENFDLIKEMVLRDTELLERVTDDFADIEAWEPWNFKWLGWFEDFVCKALLSYHEENDCVLIVHMHIPKRYRKDGSFRMGSGLLEFLENNIEEQYVKLNAKIPALYPDVVRFAEKCGFEKEGVDRKSHKKYNKYYDRVIMGKVIR